MSNFINWEKISELKEADIIRIREAIMVRAKNLTFQDGSINEDYVNAEIKALNNLYSIFGGRA